MRDPRDIILSVLEDNAGRWMTVNEIHAAAKLRAETDWHETCPRTRSLIGLMRDDTEVYEIIASGSLGYKLAASPSEAAMTVAHLRSRARKALNRATIIENVAARRWPGDAATGDLFPEADS